jgi:hypothetical protein
MTARGGKVKRPGSPFQAKVRITNHEISSANLLPRDFTSWPEEFHLVNVPPHGRCETKRARFSQGLRQAVGVRKREWGTH